MIICFKCKPETKEILDILLEAGQYKDFGEVIESAVQNLIIIQDEVQKKGTVVFGDISDGFMEQMLDPTVQGNSSEYTDNSKHRQKPWLGNRSSIIPDIFLLKELPDLPPNIIEEPSDNWMKGQEVPLDWWFFGQYNRLLPVKASSRALAHLMVNDPDGVNIDKAVNIISREASILGNYLLRHDKRHDIHRDDALSTAFPSLGKKTEKSQSRFGNQFVVSVNKQGQVSGLLFDLGLINITSTEKPSVLLTEAGWKFATLLNPVLDGMQDAVTQKFSHEEINFLLSHISRSVPAEDFAYRAIMKAIKSGANSPDSIDSTLIQYISKDKEQRLSRSFLSSQRSGAISRMVDLELVTRVRDGIRVIYVVTDNGDKYLKGE